MNKIKVGVYTGNRAEYGLQYPIIKALACDDRFELFLIVSGAHLDVNFGKTITEIENDGVNIYATVNIDMTGDNLAMTPKAIGSGILSLIPILEKLSPDYFIVYADRFEGFSALITSTQMGIPTAHIEGGDVTEGGALDDSVRHAMTKLAHLHFTTNHDASKRIERMGEEPWRIHTVGFPGIDLINAGNFATPEELAEIYKIDIHKPLVIYTQHSIATEYDQVDIQMQPTIEALTRLSGEGVQVIMTFPNNDAGGERISALLSLVKSEEKQNIQVFKSLGRYNYHGILHLCGRVTNGACVGNSSSGIKETPAFGCPVVNIGDRQKGRLRAANVIDSKYNAESIYRAIHKTLFDKDFRKIAANCENPYGTGNVGKKIADILAKQTIDLKLIQKKITY